MNDGGPAFPALRILNDAVSNESGMTLRDYFAGKAMQGMLSQDRAIGIDPYLFARESEVAYLVADAMLKARET